MRIWLGEAADFGRRRLILLSLTLAATLLGFVFGGTRLF